MRELINQQVHDDEGLEAKDEPLSTPEVTDLAVGTHSNDHVDRHHRCLEHDPSLLRAIRDGRVVSIVIVVLLLNEVRVHLLLSQIVKLVLSELIELVFGPIRGVKVSNVSHLGGFFSQSLNFNY